MQSTLTNITLKISPLFCPRLEPLRITFSLPSIDPSFGDIPVTSGARGFSVVYDTYNNI